MDQQTVFRRRGLAFTLAFLALTTTQSACGGDSGGMTGPPEEEPGPPTDPGGNGGNEGGGDHGPAPVGTVMYAVDLRNNFLVFGSGSIGTLTAKTRISGVPILKRIIGLAIRPADNAVIGVGNDNRVYTIDPYTAHATPVSSTPFSPGIASMFDIHFAMSLEPNGTRVRLISAESGGNWSIDIHTGTATTGKPTRYGAGSSLEGRTPRLLGIVYPILPDSAKGPGRCPNLAYGADADRAIVLASCDPDTGFWYQTGRTPPGTSSALRSRASSSSSRYDREWEELKDQLLRCGEWMHNVGGSRSDGEDAPPQGGGPWFPRSPDTEFYTFLVEVGTKMNRTGTVKLIDGEKWGLTLGPNLPSEDEVQGVVYDKIGSWSPSRAAGTGWPPLQAKVERPLLESDHSGEPKAGCTNPEGSKD